MHGLSDRLMNLKIDMFGLSTTLTEVLSTRSKSDPTRGSNPRPPDHEQ